MARTTDDLYDKLDELIDVMTNRGGGHGGAASYRPRAGYVSDKELNEFSKVTKWIEEAVGQVGAMYNEVKSLTDP